MLSAIVFGQAKRPARHHSRRSRRDQYSAQDFPHAPLEDPAAQERLPSTTQNGFRANTAPTGPVQNLTGLKFSAGGQTLPGCRDLKDGWTLHVEVPAGQTEVTADLDFVSPGGEGIYTSGGSATEKMTVINLEHARPLPGRLQIRRPYLHREPETSRTDGSSAPPCRSQTRTAAAFSLPPISLTLLVDSPVITGQYMKVVPLNPGKTPSVEMDIASDSAAALEAPPEVWEQYKNLVTQATNPSELSTIATITLCSV